MTTAIFAATRLPRQILIRAGHQAGVTAIATPVSPTEHHSKGLRLQPPYSDTCLGLGINVSSQPHLCQGFESQAVQRQPQLLRTKRQYIQLGQRLKCPSSEQPSMTAIYRSTTLILGQGDKTWRPGATEQLEMTGVLLVRPGTAARAHIEIQFWITPGSQALQHMNDAMKKHG